MLMSVDDAARNFTALMDRVRKGETVTLVDRDGTQASVSPVSRGDSAERIAASLDEFQASRGEPDETFGDDVEAIREFFRPGGSR